jgi:hypothetical protein
MSPSDTVPDRLQVSPEIMKLPTYFSPELNLLECLTDEESALITLAESRGIDSTKELLADFRRCGALSELTLTVLRTNGWHVPTVEGSVAASPGRKIKQSTVSAWLAVRAAQESENISEARAIDTLAMRTAAENGLDFEKESVRIKQAVQRAKRYWNNVPPHAYFESISSR